MNPKELRQKRAGLIEQARAKANDPKATAEDLAAVDAMLTEADALKAQIDRLERSESLFAELGREIGARAEVSSAFVADTGRERAIFAKMVRAGGNAALTDTDKTYIADVVARDQRILRAMATGSTGRLSPEDQQHYANAFGEIKNAGATSSPGAGGYTIAPLFEAQLLIALKAWGGMRAASRTIQTDTGANLPWPTMDDTSNVATILGTENTSVGTGTDLAFGQKSLGAFTYVSGAVPVSLQLLQDSAFDFGSLVEQALVVRFGRGQNAHFTNGSGSGQPQGIVTAAAAGPVGATGQTVTVTWENFVDLEHSVDPAYRPGAKFMMHDSTLQAIKKLVDNYGRPLFLPGITTGAPDTLLGYPLIINQDMPVMAASAKSILFGNFDNYIIRDTLGMQMMVLRERYADLLQVAWIAYMRSDGRLVSAASPVKYYQNSAT